MGKRSPLDAALMSSLFVPIHPCNFLWSSHTVLVMAIIREFVPVHVSHVSMLFIRPFAGDEGRHGGVPVDQGQQRRPPREPELRCAARRGPRNVEVGVFPLLPRPTASVSFFFFESSSMFFVSTEGNATQLASGRPHWSSKRDSR